MNQVKQFMFWTSIGLTAMSTQMACKKKTAVRSESQTKADANSTSSARDALISNLKKLQNSGQFLFGQQSYSLMAKDDNGTRNILWNDEPLLESGSKKLVGDDPGLLGIDVHYFAIVDNQNAHKQTAKAVKKHLDNDGLVAFDWHMRGCFGDDNTDKGMYTNVDAYGSQGAKKENNKCVCAIANNWDVKDGQKGKDWLNERIDLFAAKIKALGPNYANKPMVFRPYHEHTGNWFWWHEPYWNCKSFDEAASTSQLVTGADAYKALFRYTVNRLRKEPHGLDNFLIAYSPDKLYVERWNYDNYPPSESSNKGMSVDNLMKKYQEALPKDVVDIYGFDIYDPLEVHGESAANSLRAVSALAERDGKIAALTETGSYKIDEGKKSWYMTDLVQKTIGDAKLSFVMTWENRAKSYVPVAGGTDKDDFKRFYNHDKSLFLSQIKGLFQPGFAALPPQSEVSVPSAPPGSESESEEKKCVDEDGDGWGWDGEKSCKM